jgi:hypothetical protein
MLLLSLLLAADCDHSRRSTCLEYSTILRSRRTSSLCNFYVSTLYVIVCRRCDQNEQLDSGDFYSPGAVGDGHGVTNSAISCGCFGELKVEPIGSARIVRSGRSRVNARDSSCRFALDHSAAVARFARLAFRIETGSTTDRARSREL